MRTQRSIAAVLTGGLVAAATLLAAPAAEAAAGYTTVVQWEGGRTKVCRVDDPTTGTSRVKVSWDGKAHDDVGPYKKTGAGGLAKAVA